MTELNNLRWLLGDEGRNWLERLAGEDVTSVTVAARVRRELSAEQAHLVLEQIELRRRARAKFAAADSMFFTPLGLEQATDEHVAAYKTSRFPAGLPRVDLCCGIGGDLRALSSGEQAIGVDRDPAVALIAAANCPTAQVMAADVSDFALNDAAWHIDPDRRPKGRRTTQIELHEPPTTVLRELLARTGNAAIKLAPAADTDDPLLDDAELEWISRDRECRQLVAWFGALRRGTSDRTATIIREEGKPAHRVCGAADVIPTVTQQIRRYVFEPDAAVLAAHLVGALAEREGLHAIHAQVAYLTGDEPLTSPALSPFEVLDVLPFDEKKLKAWLRERNIGRLEVKKRGVEIEPESLRKKLRVAGEASATLILTPFAERVVAILARRVK